MQALHTAVTFSLPPSLLPSQMEAVVVYKKESLEFFNGLGVLSFLFCFVFICSQVK